MPVHVPFVGGSYELRRKKADVQRSINLRPTLIESGSGKSAQYLKSIEGLTVFSTAPPPPPPCDVILSTPAGLTLRVQYLFDGNFVDSSGNLPPLDRLSGSINTTIYRCGTGSMSLPTYGSYASYTSDPYGIALPGDFEFRCFIYPTALDAGIGNSCLFSCRGGAPPLSTLWAIGVGANGLFMHLGAVKLLGDNGAPIFTLNEWQKVTVKRVGSNIYFKRNDVLLGTLQASGFANTANGYLSVGFEPYLYMSSMVGYVDSLSLWTA